MSLPCTVIVVNKVLETRDLQDYVKEYVSQLSIGAVFKAGINRVQDFVAKPSNSEFLADLLMYFNMGGVVYLLIHSIIIRRDLVQMAQRLDNKELSPSDYALVVRNIPKNVTKERLV